MLKVYILFIGCLYYLSAQFHSCCFYIQYHRSVREITTIPVKIFCFILCSILFTRWRNTPLHTMFVLAIKKGPDLNLAPQSTICSNTPDLPWDAAQVSYLSWLPIIVISYCMPVWRKPVVSISSYCMFISYNIASIFLISENLSLFH